MRIVVLAAVAAAGARRHRRVPAGVDRDQSRHDHGHRVLARERHDHTGDPIKWTNSDTKSHQVVANNGSFASPTIAAGKTLHAHVQHGRHLPLPRRAAPEPDRQDRRQGPPPAVTIGAATPILDYGSRTHISGAVSKQGRRRQSRCGPSPTARPLRCRSRRCSPARTASGTCGQADAADDLPGALEEPLSARRSASSCGPSIASRPTSATARSRSRQTARSRARRSYLQKFTRFHEWVKVRLGRPRRDGSAKRFLLGLPRGHRYAVRIFMSLNQVGAGYLDGYSRTVVVKAPR